MWSFIIAIVIVVICRAAFTAWKERNPEKWAKLQREARNFQPESGKASLPALQIVIGRYFLRPTKPRDKSNPL